MKKIYTLVSSTILVLLVQAQTPELVKDINTTTTDVFSSSFPKKGVTVNGKFYFPATNHNGNELWSTNGTAPGTSMVRDLESFAAFFDGNPQLFTVFGDTLFFFARGGVVLYRYITSTNNFENVLTVFNGAPTEAVRSGDYIYFNGDLDNGEGNELIRYNVKTNSTTSFDINSGPDDSNPHYLTVKGDTVFFSATDVLTGTELWMYDPYISFTTQVKDIQTGPNSSDPSDLIIYRDKLWFTADDGLYGDELWSSDGSDMGTELFSDLNSNNLGLDPSNPRYKTVFKDTLFFSADDGFGGIELWAAEDGGYIGQVADINPFGDSEPGRFGFRQAGGYLYFAADDGNTGVELWRTDGVMTEQVEDINPFDDSAPMDMYNLSDTLIFVANDGNGSEIWRTDGINTAMVQNIQPSFADTVRIAGVYNGYVYFGADNGTLGQELWKSNGLSGGTSLVKDLNFGNDVSSLFPTWFEKLGDVLYFGAQSTPGFKFGLHKTDGTNAGTTQVKAGGGAEEFSVGYDRGRKVGTTLYFAGYTTTAGNELWKTDGTLANTVMVKDINPGVEGSNMPWSIELGSLLIFVANDGVNGYELWKSDGTEAGTVLLKNIHPGTDFESDIREFKLVNGKVVFQANDGVNGDELWVTDGTAPGTVMLKNINGSATNSNVSNLSVIGNNLYFTADDGVNGNELWITDGTPAGTVLYKDINPGPEGSDPSDVVQLGGWLYFGAKNATASPQKLWRTDGNPNNTSQFFDVNFPFFMTNVGSRIVFWALPASSPNGFHLWVTDGTVGGTMELEDFLPGTMSYLLIDQFPVYNGNWFMWLDNGISGQELWKTNGTVPGTMMYDIAPGPMSSYPRGAKGINPLVFAAHDGTVIGNELYKLDVAAVLPVTGLEFNVTKQGTKGYLEWSTLTEDNNKGFEVQESVDGVRFTSLDFVPAKGIAGSGADYSYTDINTTTGKNYYRLKQLDHDGQFKYSQVRWIDFSKNGYVNAYPNPASDVLHINTGYTFKDATLNIRNMGGQLVKRIKVTGSGTTNIPVADLASGVYHAEIIQPGMQNVRIVFVRQ